MSNIRRLELGLDELEMKLRRLEGEAESKAVSPNDLAYEINRLRRFDIEELKRLARRAKHDTG